MEKIKSYVKKYKYFIFPLLLITLAIPIAIQILMNYGFVANIKGGTDDGWLGFWGGYLGSIISISGVFITFSLQRNDDMQKEKRSKRPIINIAYQNGINIGDEVHHSTLALTYHDAVARIINIYNPSDNVAINILVAIYNNEDEIFDIINIQQLRNQHTSVYFRNNNSTTISKIVISFLTERNEFGTVYEKYQKDESFNDTKLSYDSNSENIRKTIIKAFNEHNKNLSSISTDKWNRNVTFITKELRYNWTSESINQALLKK